MYDSCLICHADLGTNQVISAFPVGRRIAFDPADRRIWVICQSCHEWNLAPIGERWDAIEECEAVFKAAVQRVSSEHGAVAAIDGTEIIRIGSPGSDGLVTWRYTDRLEARRTAKLARKRGRAIGRNVALVLTLLIPPLLLGPGGMIWSGVAFVLAIPLLSVTSQRRRREIIARVEGEDGRWIDITRSALANVRLVPDPESWSLRIRGRDHLSGAKAVRAARLLLAHVNWRLSDPAMVKKAQEYILSRGRSVDQVFRAASRRRGIRRTARLAKLDPHIRLALEMVANEETEREAIRSELRYLHGEWQQAQELARIQDELLLPESVEKEFQKLRSQAAPPEQPDESV